MEIDESALRRMLQNVATRLEEIDERLREQYTGRPPAEIVGRARQAFGSALPEARLNDYAEAVSNDRPFAFNLPYQVRYTGPTAIVSALEQALTQEGVTVEYERPDETRSAAEIAQEVVVNLACSGTYAAITAGVNKFRASRLGSIAKVETPDDDNKGPEFTS